MKPSDNEYSFVRRNGEWLFVKGFVTPWTPQVTDQFGFATDDPARDLQSIKNLYALPLKHRAVMQINGTNAQRQEIEHYIRLIAHINEREGRTKFSFRRSAVTFSIQRHETKTPVSLEKRTDIPTPASDCCPICHTRNSEPFIDFGVGIPDTHRICWMKQNKVRG